MAAIPVEKRRFEFARVSSVWLPTVSILSFSLPSHCAPSSSKHMTAIVDRIDSVADRIRGDDELTRSG